MRGQDLPTSLGVVFEVGAARRAGVGRRRLRGTDLERVFHGARSVADATLVADEDAAARRTYPRGAAAAGIHRLAAQYVPVMSSAAFFVGVTAAVLWEAPLPGRLLRDGGGVLQPFSPDRLEVGVHWPERAPRGRGVRGHSVRPHLVPVVTHPVSGLRVSSPAATWAMLGAVVLHPYDLVAVADHVVRIRRPPHTRPWQETASPLCTTVQLASALAAGRRVGAARSAAALARVRTGSDSRPETWTRLTLVDAGLPEPVLDYDVFDRVCGFVARVDMAYPLWRIAVEYDGHHHGIGEQWECDVERHAALEAAGWRVIRVTATLLFQHPDDLVARVRAAIASRAS